MKISVGSDHAGYPMKPQIMEYLRSMGHEVTDVGCYSTEPVDFPDIARLVCGDVLEGRSERGIMICGTGIGASIACNKIPGIRASLSHDLYSAHQCVEDDDANVLCLGAQIVGSLMAQEIIGQFLAARFSAEPEFRKRVEKLNRMDGSIRSR